MTDIPTHHVTCNKHCRLNKKQIKTGLLGVISGRRLQ